MPLVRRHQAQSFNETAQEIKKVHFSPYTKREVTSYNRHRASHSIPRKELNRIIEAHRVKLQRLKLTIEKSDAAIKKYSKPLTRKRKVKSTEIHTCVEQ